jgi:histidinol-phosphate aminotransferase
MGADMTTIGRAGLDRIPSYRTAPLPGVDLDLRDNVNLWGAPPAALAAVRDAQAAQLREYPAVSATALTGALAVAVGVRPSEVVVGCGSDDVIDAFLRAVAAPGDLVAHADPSFSMVPIFARLNGLEPVAVPLRRDGSADVDAMLATGARVMYLCSPNNPTGTVTSEAEIRRLIAHAPGVVLVDEAYAEFTGLPDWRADAPGMERVLVTRTFSKAWGMAGVRLGYGVGGAELVDAVAKSRGPYKVNALGELAAVTALRADVAWMEAAARDAIVVRDRLATALRGRVGVRVHDSRGNFLFLEVADRATELAARFQARGIGVRAFTGLTGIGDALRIGVAPWERMARVEALALELWP